MAWNVHSPQPGVYNFTDGADVVQFIKTAQEVGLLVLLRPGPYICGRSYLLKLIILFLELTITPCS